MDMPISYTHRTAFKNLLAADLGDLRREAIFQQAKIAVLEKEAILLRARADTLAAKVNEQEQIITGLRI